MNELIGKKYGRLTVIDKVGKTKDRHLLYLCVCDCGNECAVASNMLKSGHTQSCGCLRKERTSQAKKKHGGVLDHKNIERLYMVWTGIGQRCNNPKNKSYKYYGARGIKRCEEWDDYANFREWAISNGYDETANFGECTIDRINCDGDYEPNNCRFVTIANQNRNKRKKKDEVEE